MLKLEILVGTTRPGRKTIQVAKWIETLAKQNKNFAVELVDLMDYNLPLLDEPMSPMMGQYSNEHTKRWSAKISEADAFLMVTPEYNHSLPGSLKNAIDFLSREWSDKPVAFVGLGATGGQRAIEHLRQIVSSLKMYDLRDHVLFSLFEDFEKMTEFKPAERHLKEVKEMLDSLAKWAKVFKEVRETELK
jgi:NAD(P)H-dependent FMN reductase